MRLAQPADSITALTGLELPGNAALRWLGNVDLEMQRGVRSAKEIRDLLPVVDARAIILSGGPAGEAADRDTSQKCNRRLDDTSVH